LALGGLNPEDPMKVVDFQKPYQRHLLSFAGMKDVAFERVEGTAFGPEAAKKRRYNQPLKAFRKCSQKRLDPNLDMG